MKKITLLSILAALTIGSAQAETVVKIATMSPLSGPQSDLGAQLKNGAQLALNEYQGEFKKMGMTLKLAPFDDQADPATGTSAARKIASDKSILALMGTLNSGVAIPVSEALKASNVVMVSGANTANLVTDRGLPNMNRIVARDGAQGPAAATFLVDQLKGKKFYIINSKDAYGAGLAKEVEKALKAKKVKVLANEGTEEKSDFSGIIAKVKLMKPDAIFYGGTYNQGAVIIKQLREAGVKVPVMGGDGLDSGELTKIVGAKNANDIYFTTVAAPLEALPASKAFAANFKKTFNDEAQGFGATGYDATKVILQGILAAAKANGGKVPNRKQVESAIRKGKFTGLLTGDVSFNSMGDRQKATMYVMEVQKGKRNLKDKISVTPDKK